jgi:hypothetical protein
MYMRSRPDLAAVTYVELAKYDQWYEDIPLQ